MASDTQQVSILTSPIVGDARSQSAGLVPIELLNGVSEEGCQIDSDDPNLTNVIRRHYLDHFGHRDLEKIVADYADDAVVYKIANGNKQRFQGHREIRAAFEGIFALHPAGSSKFRLKHVVVSNRVGIAVWDAETPTSVFPHSSDTFVFDEGGNKIKTQYLTCSINQLEK